MHDLPSAVAIISLALTAVSFIAVILLLVRLREIRSEAKQNSIDNAKNAEFLSMLIRKTDEAERARSAQALEESERFAGFSGNVLRSQLEAERQLADSLLKMRQDMETGIGEIRKTVGEKLTETLNSRLDSSFATVSGQLENVYKSMGEMKELSESVTANVNGLNRVLTNVKSRGTWGEAQLRSILDDVVPTLYETNVATNPLYPQKRVEFAVRMHTGGNAVTYLPIDSKFPVEDYARLCEAADNNDPEAMQEAKKSLKTRLISEARSVAEYIHEPDTAPFAVLYLATEGLYAEVASDEKLTSRIRSENRILICGPTTVAALLNSLALGMRTVEINKKAEEIRALLVETRNQYVKFADQLAKARKKLSEAEGALDEAERNNTRISRKLEKADLGEAAGQPSETLISE